MTSPLTSGAPPSPDSSAASAARSRVLVMDDSSDLVESLAAGLALLGFETQTATTTDAALGAMASWLPHIAFLDLSMPNSSGMDVLQTARSAEWGRNVVMIAMTGWSSDIERNRALDAGFDVFLEKPFDLSALGSLLNRYGKT